MENNNDFGFIKEIIEIQLEHVRWSTALTLLISIAVASLIALLSSFLELQSSTFFSDARQDTEKITIKGDLLIPRDTIISDKNFINYNHAMFQSLKDTISFNGSDYSVINRDTIKIKNLTFNYVEEKSKLKSKFKISANQILFSCTTLLSLIFTLFIYIIRRNIEGKIRDLDKKIIESKK